MQIERHEIRIFSAVVEEAGFSRAAERLNISQSAVSQAVANLEHKLGAVLLVRKQQPELTEAGNRLFRYAQMVLKEERAALEDIAQIRTGALSTLSLAVNSMVNRYFAPALLLEFCDQNPLTRLKLDVAPSKEIIYGVDDDRWELGFGPFQKQMPGHFVSRPYLSEQRVLVVHEHHPKFEALGQDPGKTLAEVTLLTSYLDDAVAKSGGGARLRDAFQGVWEVTNLRLRLALAEAGKGVTYLSDHLLKDLAGFHAIAKLEHSTIHREVGVYYKKHKPLTEGAKRFLAICERHFANAES
ncbi:MAG: LysR family transcriptional regulator [Pseudomonadales bacterium]